MVIGLDIFKKYFKDYQGAYLIIGGTACDILIEDAGFEPRATDDIDIVLIIEGIKVEFVKTFWEFIKLGEYEIKQYNPEKKNSYRFCDPRKKDFPKQIELFCKVSDAIKLDDSMHLTPIPTDEGLSNLSAILLDEEYYQFTIKHSTINDDIHHANIEAIICLKAFAYLDNKKRKELGEKVRKRDVVKHKYDIFRMIFLMPPDSNFSLPETIKKHLLEFVQDVKEDLPTPEIFKANGFGKQDMEKLLNLIIKIFQLD